MPDGPSPVEVPGPSALPAQHFMSHLYTDLFVGSTVIRSFWLSNFRQRTENGLAVG